MKTQSLGMTIASLRKEKGMTQLELAEMMRVTDKAVSKWERDLSYPDISSIPRLAELLGTSVDELLSRKVESKDGERHDKANKLVKTIFTGVALAMGVACCALYGLKQIEPDSAIAMLGIGLACLAVSLLRENGD